jgi:carbon monoxide dehydrogenase subunit G
MDLTNEFIVDAPIETLWEVLTDVERISPCIPGFELKQVQGDEFDGTMKVKVGAVTMQYASKGRFVERDDDAHRAVMTAEGRELRGQGGVSATITSTLTEEEGRTKAMIATNLSVTGRVAQFGRGILADVSDRLVGQFVACLETTVMAANSTPAEGAGPAGTQVSGAEGDATALRASEGQPAGRKNYREPAEPVDLLDVAGAPILKRLAIVGATAALLLALVALVRRLRS